MKKKVSIAIVILILIFVGLVCLNLKKTITRENTIEGFCQNINHFNTIKDYMLKSPKDYSISIGTYRTEIKDEKVVEAVNYLVRDLKYERIYNYSESNNKESYYVVFLRGGSNDAEYGIIYAENKTNAYGMVMELIKGNWYFHWMQYI